MVTALVILNIILIVILLTIVVLYLFRKKKDTNTHCVTSVCVSDDNCIEFKKQETNINSEKVFVGRFITEEEYQQMMKNRKSDISILLDEVNSEYEHLKELNK